jgi:hypothetical protein
MCGMFDWIDMIGNYEERKVDRYELGDILVDTARVTDGQKPYETGVYHPEYDNGRCIIVEAYDTKEKAQEGHDKWVKILTSPNLPPTLKDCCNAGIIAIAATLGVGMEFPHNKGCNGV